MAIEHKLKTLAVYYDAVARGDKTFEVRRNDRAFQKGDILVLEKWKDETYRDFSNASMRFRITYLLQGGQFGIEPGFCILGITPDVTEPTKGGE